MQGDAAHVGNEMGATYFLAKSYAPWILIYPIRELRGVYYYRDCFRTRAKLPHRLLKLLPNSLLSTETLVSLRGQHGHCF